MGGNVTQTRTLPLDVLPWRNTYNGIAFTSGTISGGATSYRTPSQTTTSYRSGRSEMPVDDVTVARSLGEFTKKLIEEDHNTRHGYDTGHDFNTFRQSHSMTHSNAILTGVTNTPNTAARFTGPIVPYTSNSSEDLYPTVSDITSSETNFYGAAFIQNTTPVNSVAGLSVALAEFYREGLPRLAGAHTLRNTLRGRPKGVGEEYLNWEFGYKPLANDLAVGLAAVVGASAIINQYLRDSGRTVRRRRVLRTDISTTSTNKAMQLRLGALATGSNGSDRYFVGASSSGTGSVYSVTEVKYSFSAAYTYHIPDHNDFLGKIDYYARLVDKTLGIGVSPDTLWNLAPWTWLGDWSFSLGNIISNLSNFSSDSLVMRYAYLMRETKVTKTISHPGRPLVSGGRLDPVSVSMTTVKKERVKATPYGFGLNPSSFSSRQWAILGALGLTKAPTTLR